MFASSTIMMSCELRKDYLIRKKIAFRNETKKNSPKYHISFRFNKGTKHYTTFNFRAGMKNIIYIAIFEFFISYTQMNFLIPEISEGYVKRKLLNLVNYIL